MLDACDGELRRWSDGDYEDESLSRTSRLDGIGIPNACGRSASLL